MEQDIALDDIIRQNQKRPHQIQRNRPGQRKNNYGNFRNGNSHYGQRSKGSNNRQRINQQNRNRQEGRIRRGQNRDRRMNRENDRNQGRGQRDVERINRRNYNVSQEGNNRVSLFFNSFIESTKKTRKRKQK